MGQLLAGQIALLQILAFCIGCSLSSELAASYSRAVITTLAKGTALPTM
jgi:hypothetical protein